MERARADLLGRPAERPPVPFSGDLHTAFYGQREFSIRHPDGVSVTFYHPIGDDVL